MRFRTDPHIHSYLCGSEPTPQVHTHLHALKGDAGPLPPYPRPASRPQGTRVKGLRNISCRTSQGCGGRRTHHQGLVEFVVQVGLLGSLHQILRQGHEGESERGKEASGRVRSTPGVHPREPGTDTQTSACTRTCTTALVTVAKRQTGQRTGNQPARRHTGSSQLHSVQGRVRHRHCSGEGRTQTPGETAQRSAVARGKQDFSRQ